jgi:acyl-CoA reductase-like NAD-dependent aldehyde dehydrogenase
MKYVEPTIIVNPDKNSDVMVEEIFGPILPVMTYEKID